MSAYQATVTVGNRTGRTVIETANIAHVVAFRVDFIGSKSDNAGAAAPPQRTKPAQAPAPDTWVDEEEDPFGDQ